MAVLICLFLYLVVLVNSCTRDNYQSFPALPQKPTASLPSGVSPSGTVTQNHWSEGVTLLRPPAWTGHQPQTNCPHLDSNLLDWHNPATWGGSVPTNGNSVTIPAGKKVLISSCSIDPSFVFKLVTIPADSALVFGDAPISFSAYGITNQGNLSIGSPTCRLRNYVTITIYGKRSDQTFPAPEYVKGIYSTGGIDIHGVEYAPTWTRLAATAKIGDTYLFIQDCPNWEIGHQIFVTTTELKDARDFNRNEERTIKGIFKTTLGANVCAIQIDTPLLYNHYGGKEYQAEVGLLTRRVKVQGDALNSDATDNATIVCTDSSKPSSTYTCEDTNLNGFGVHIMAASKGSRYGRFSGLEVYRGGQTNVMARYPIHFHMIGNVSTAGAYFVSDCAVHKSLFRCVTIHGTSGVTLETGVVVTKNVGFDVTGHCFFCSEDGVEEQNTISYNLGAFIHPLGPTWQTMYGLSKGSKWISSAGQSFGSQYTNYIRSTPNGGSLILADDTAASPFYFTNAYVSVIGNAASGGWAGFTFPNLPRPKGAYVSNTWLIPKNRPLIAFKGNSAHSTGYYQGHAAGVYLGGDLKPAADLTLTEYTTGRYLPARDTNDDPYGRNGNEVWLRFEDTKVFLSNVGLQSWGDREEIVRFEVHDVQVSTNVFGHVWIDQMLVNCRSNNVPTKLAGCTFPVPPWENNAWSRCNDADRSFHTGNSGFQFYDTGQSHIITNSRFSNCLNARPDCLDPANCGLSIWLYLTHSDQFTPGLMQMTKNISYVNVAKDKVAVPSTKVTDKVTVSGRDANWLDADGTVFPDLNFAGQKVNIGSNWAGPDWWRYNSKCVNTTDCWVCPMSPGDSVASMNVHWNPTLESSIGNGYCSNGAIGYNPVKYAPCPFGAKVTHFGRSEANAFDVSLSPRVTGPIIASQGGWYIHYTGGTPKKIFFDEIQVDHDAVLHVAIPYPSGTTFKVYVYGPNWCTPGTEAWSAVCQHDFQPVTSVAAVREAWGDKYFFDSSTNLLHLRIVDFQSFSAWPYFSTLADKAKNLVFGSTSTKSNYFSRGGVSLLTSGSNSFKIYVEVTSGNCEPKCQDVGSVPPANPLAVTSSPTNAPTKQPTAPPTAAPKQPTTAPTVNPTAAPKQPTAAPTVNPTAAPKPPTAAPKPPTAAPTVNPTAAPKQPTSAPKQPTSAPKQPTTAPTVNPTSAPKQPTTAPKQPTTAPKQPTAAPTVSPTAAPKTSVPTTMSISAVDIPGNSLPQMGRVDIKVSYSATVDQSRIQLDIQNTDGWSWYGGGSKDVSVGSGTVTFSFIISTTIPIVSTIQVKAWIVTPANYGKWDVPKGEEFKIKAVTVYKPTPPSVTPCNKGLAITSDSDDWWIKATGPAGLNVKINCGNYKEVPCVRSWDYYACSVSDPSLPNGPCPVPRVISCSASGARIEGEEESSEGSSFPAGGIVGIAIAGAVVVALFIVAVVLVTKKSSASETI